MKTNLALTADWLPTFGGAEHVIAEFTKLFPEAPLFTTVARPERLGTLNQAELKLSRLQKWYRLIKNHKIMLPLMPRVMEDMDLRGYDVILSSSHAVGKGIIPPPTAKHICYCHTPMRYAWEMEEEYLDDFGVPRILRPAVRSKLKQLRAWDLTTAKRTDAFIANSNETKNRIERIYNREATVIYPPVSDEFFSNQSAPAKSEPYFLAIGRLVPYKRFDLLIQTANELKLPLKIAGRGDDFNRLKKLAGSTVELLGHVPQAELKGLYTNATALLLPQHEDAGVVQLEAQACGTPVIAYFKGGAKDTVIDGKTGLFFEEQTVAALAETLRQFSQMQFDKNEIIENARQFSSTNFRQRISDFIAAQVT